LITQAYYIYNHGSNKPPGFDYVNGVLEPIDYSNDSTVSQGAKDAQNNALSVQRIFNNQSWTTGKTGCQGPQ
jgi:hypothetical protein